jgi:hypothetical protein
MTTSSRRQPLGRRVRCPEGYWAYVPAPLPPAIASGLSLLPSACALASGEGEETNPRRVLGH